MSPRPFTPALDILRQAKLRPTRQRLALTRLLYGRGHRHVSAEQLHAEAQGANVRVSLATVYNTLHHLNRLGLLREVVVEPGRSYFDTNTDEHHHFYFEDHARLEDIPAERVTLAAIPEPPEGTRIRRVDVVVRVGSDKN